MIVVEVLHDRGMFRKIFHSLFRIDQADGSSLCLEEYSRFAKAIHRG